MTTTPWEGQPQGVAPTSPISFLRPLRSLRLIFRFRIRFGCGFAALGSLRLNHPRLPSDGAMNRAPTRSISFLRHLGFLRLILRVSTGRVRKPALARHSLRSMRSLRLILLFGCGSASLGLCGEYFFTGNAE